MNNLSKLFWSKGLQRTRLVRIHHLLEFPQWDKLDVVIVILESVHEAIVVNKNNADKITTIDARLHGKTYESILRDDKRVLDEGLLTIFPIINPFGIIRRSA